MRAMTFKQGKFYDKKGNVVPLEFGNKAQLQIIEKAKAMKEEGILHIGPIYRCFCGAVHEKEFRDGKKFKCECGMRYQFILWGDEVPTIKLL